MTNPSLSRLTVREVQANGFKSIASVINLTIISTIAATMMILMPELTNQTIRSMICMCSMSRAAFAEDGRTDGHHRRALFNRYFKIVTHPHLHLAVPVAESSARGERVSQLS